MKTTVKLLSLLAASTLIASSAFAADGRIVAFCVKGTKSYPITISQKCLPTYKRVTFAGSTAGTTGITSITGPQGLQGAKGEKGDQGIQGIQGVTGPKGDQGIQGETGAKGDQGIQGETGAKGDQGIQGETGAKGEQGIQGEAGSKGDQGDQGIPGLVNTASCETVLGSTTDSGTVTVSVQCPVGKFMMNSFVTNDTSFAYINSQIPGFTDQNSETHGYAVALTVKTRRVPGIYFTPFTTSVTAVCCDAGVSPE